MKPFSRKPLAAMAKNLLLRSRKNIDSVQCETHGGAPFCCQINPISTAKLILVLLVIGAQR